ncbi:MAG: RNA 2',3'-cyclic phosphodiesterase [Bacteroidia bacterium]|jgi:2'-5' RNA ligase|nr:RNA 2',3'-cyclic phosphodiesterase [Bacteroidia bacterium]GIV23566.1 MAG: RNA 2',3'-cyclic phosphodiesterase [Bacteroidia bacterium]
MRLFVGLALPPAAVAWIMQHKPLLLPPRARWVPPSQWHVTLLFLEEWPETKVEALHAAIEPILQGHSALQLIPTHIKWVRRTLWIQLGNTPIFKEMVERLHRALNRPVPQEIHPHITIARSPVPITLESIGVREQEAFLFTVAYLYQSVLHPTGPEYIPLRRYLFDVTLPR